MIHDFLGWPRTGSNPADINQFRSHTGKDIIEIIVDKNSEVSNY